MSKSAMTLCFVALAGIGAAIAWQPLMTTALLLFVVASVALSSPKTAKYALLALAAYTPVETIVLDYVPEPLYMAARFGPQGLMLGCLAGVMARRAFAGKSLWVRNPLDVPLLVFLLASVISFLINRPPLVSAVVAYQPFLRFILIAYALVLLVDYDVCDATRLTRVLLVVAAGVAAVGIAQSCFPERLNPLLTPQRGEYGDYVIGGFSQPAAYETGYQVFSTLGRYNICGLYLAFFFVLGLPFFVAYPHRRRLFYGLYALLLPCIYLTSARTAFVFVAVGVMTLFALRKRWVYVWAPIAGATVLAGLLGAHARFVGYEEATTVQRVLEVLDPFYLAVTSQFGRLYFILRFPFEIFSLGVGHALFGFGPGALDWRSMELYGLTPLDALNVPPATARGISDVNWSYILGQAGCVALAAVVWMCWRLGKAAYRVRRDHPDLFVRCMSEGFIAVLAAQCAAAFFAPVWEWRPTSLYLWLYAGLVVAFLLRMPNKMKVRPATKTEFMWGSRPRLPFEAFPQSRQPRAAAPHRRIQPPAAYFDRSSKGSEDSQ